MTKPLTDELKGWKGSLTKNQAIKLIERATDKDDPYWEYLVEEFYDELTDTMPSIYHVFLALGVTEKEYKNATGAENVNWPISSEINTRQQTERNQVIDECVAAVEKVSVCYGHAMKTAMEFRSEVINALKDKQGE
ncbi:MAG: hypothetical protein ABFS03_00710 [Chloroflexota bacterium]